MSGSATEIPERETESWKEAMPLLDAGAVGRLDIRLANGPVERDAVYRFRHRVLGRRMGRKMGFTACDGRLLEELDVGADHLAAYGEGNIVHAAIRLEEFHAACARRGLVIGDSSRDPRPGEEEASFSSRLLVDPERGAHLTVRFMASLVTSLARRGFHRDHCLESNGDDRLRTRLGYRESPLQVVSNGVGRLLEIVLPPSDGAGSSPSGSSTSRWRLIRRRG